MLGFFKLKSSSLAEQKKTGEAIIRLITSVGDRSAGSEWAAFDADPKAWLSKHYIYTGPAAGPNGAIPASVQIVPVYDTETKMHVRIPWKGTVDPRPRPEDILPEGTYGTGDTRLPVLLARYFMRKCR
jgi:hypothetical protein